MSLSTIKQHLLRRAFPSGEATETSSAAAPRPRTQTEAAVHAALSVGLSRPKVPLRSPSTEADAFVAWVQEVRGMQPGYQGFLGVLKDYVRIRERATRGSRLASRL